MKFFKLAIQFLLAPLFMSIALTAQAEKKDFYNLKVGEKTFDVKSESSTSGNIMRTVTETQPRDHDANSMGTAEPFIGRSRNFIAGQVESSTYFSRIIAAARNAQANINTPEHSIGEVHHYPRHPAGDLTERSIRRYLNYDSGSFILLVLPVGVIDTGNMRLLLNVIDGTDRTRYEPIAADSMFLFMNPIDETKPLNALNNGGHIHESPDNPNEINITGNVDVEIEQSHEGETSMVSLEVTVEITAVLDQGTVRLQSISYPGGVSGSVTIPSFTLTLRGETEPAAEGIPTATFEPRSPIEHLTQRTVSGMLPTGSNP
ncbi:hypothetical protein NX722_10620 [Endozoicomonas gorgoniicola]|uniref:Uncharacterized protein n=1 Tax=Endozoicomonas gorgoniicola TaxID=1234144 RepID=A0ABT3MVH1_9GAMM|nr:hypothetical protein [Endozoicomonas gorgoniicola]MCW7553078.1 hypothetical protein [Endozoicomonas gorgoniicola]